MGIGINANLEKEFQIESFNTERRYDELTINNNVYSGVIDSLDWGSATSTIMWSSDYSVTKKGWKLCASPRPAPSPGPSPPSPSPGPAHHQVLHHHPARHHQV